MLQSKNGGCYRCGSTEKNIEPSQVSTSIPPMLLCSDCYRVVVEYFKGITTLLESHVEIKNIPDTFNGDKGLSTELICGFAKSLNRVQERLKEWSEENG